MPHTSLIFDCDPGVDDAIALFMAFASRDTLDLLGVTTVGGNVSAELTVRNARMIREIAGREDVPVIAGAQQPLLRPPIDAGHFHGASGLGDLKIFDPVAPVTPGHAANFIVDTVMSRPAGTVTLAVTGPMTNLALAMRLEPALCSRIGRVVAMGGARREGGNITASAEYNIYADPHAADIVARSGCPLVMIGLDATHQVRSTPDRIAVIEGLGTPQAQAVATLLAFANRTEKALGTGGASPMHDPCVIAYILSPHLFKTAPCTLGIETGSPLTLGHTAVELRVTDCAEVHVRWTVDADADGFFNLLTKLLSPPPGRDL